MVLIESISLVLPDFQRLSAHEFLLVDLILLVPKVDGEGVGEVAQVGGEDMKDPLAL